MTSPAHRTSAGPLRARRRRRQCGSATAVFISLAAVTAAVVYTGARITAEKPALAGACQLFIDRYRVLHDNGPELAGAPQLEQLRTGQTLTGDELADLHHRAQKLERMYSQVNVSLKDVAHAAKHAPHARVQVSDEAEMFTARIRQLDDRYSDSIAAVIGAGTADELTTALNSFEPQDDGPSLSAYRALYAAVASEPACLGLITVSHGLPLASEVPSIQETPTT